MSDWITDSQDEQTIEELLRDADQIHIPIFQRAYVWKQKQLDELISDINQVLSEIEETQFLGAIVAYEKPRTGNVVGRMRGLEVVDGQQRLLTLYIFIMALVETLAAIDPEEAAEIAHTFLLLPRRRGIEINTRVVPAFADRSQFRVLWDKINSVEVLQEQLKDNPPLLPRPSGEFEGDLVKQYTRISRYLRKNMPDEKSVQGDYLRQILEVVTRHLSFVHLKLNDASAATKIFERLNFRGVRVGIVDLVRNEVFSSLAEEPSEMQRIFDHVWRPFETAFDGRAEAFFFPYCLAHDSNTKKSELFVQLRAMWKDLAPEQIIEQMAPFQAPFIGIDQTGSFPSSQEISLRLDRLVRMRRPSSIYPYVLLMLKSYSDSEISEKTVTCLLDALESFLVRRAIVGIEPTGLHALFKGLWWQMKETTVEEFKKEVKKRPTIQWPSDAEVRQAVLTRPLAKSNICNYLLVEYDRSLKGDDPGAVHTIEHILPQSFDEQSVWAQDFDKETHKALKDLWANVVPLSSPQNSSLQASSYVKKRPRYLRESMFTSVRELADRWDEWTPEAIRQRSKELVDWTWSRWPDSL